MINLLYDLCPQILFFSMLYSSLWSIIESKDEVSVTGILCIAIISGLCTTAKHVLKRYITSIAMIVVLTTVGSIYGLFILNDPAYCVITIIIGLLCIISKLITSFSFMSNPENMILGIMIVNYIIVELVKFHSLGNYMFYFICAYLVMLIIYKNHMSISEYIQARRLTTIMSEKKMKRYFCMFISILCVSVIGIIIVTKTVDYTPLYDKVAHLFDYEGPTLPPDQIENEDNDVLKGTLDKINSDSDNNPPPVLLQFVYRMVKVFMIVMVVVIFIVISIYFTKVIYHLLCDSTKKAPKKKEFLFASVEVRETIEKDKTRKRVKETLGKDPKDRIRKLYKKKMNGFRKNIVQAENTYTPSEQRDLLNMQGNSVKEEVVALYEHARYSNDELQKEDVKCMEQLLK